AKDCVENDRVGYCSATFYWSDHFSFTCFASTLPVVERRSAGHTQRVKERLSLPVWTTCSQPRRVRIHRLHPRVSSPPGGNFLCGVYLHALSPASAADFRAAVRPTLPPDNEDQ